MSNLKKKKYITGLLIVFLLIAIVGLFSYGKVDKYKGLVKVKNVKLLSSVANTNAMTSKGTEEIEYVVNYTLDSVSGVSERDVVIKGSLNSDYASFKEINKTGITSTLSDSGKDIEIHIDNVTLGEPQELKLKIQVTNAPNNESIIPEISIKEATGEYTTVVGQTITVTTNSVLGIVYDENNIPVGNIELSINKDGREIRRTYTRDDGTYNFSDLETGTYQIKVEEEIYELVSGSETSESNPQNIIKVREVDKFNIETHKYIEKLNLVINGKKESYSYKDTEKVVQAIKNAKTISGQIEYKIVVRNKGEKNTAIERVIDEPGEGLEFKESKNTGWKLEDGVIKYKPIEGSTLSPKEKREIKLVLDITNTNEIKTYINKLTTKGEIKEKVVFVIDGVKYREISVIEGDVVEKPDFGIQNLDGWYTDPNYTNKYKFSNKVNKDLILYAKREGHINEYTVNFIDNGSITSSEVVREGEKVARPTDPEKTGYTFECWKLENTCYDFDEEVHQNMDLISNYNPITYNITYNLDGGTVDPSNRTSYTIETETFTLNNPTKTGFTFTGWTGTGLSQKTLLVTINQGSTGNRTYTANYDINKYQLEIDPKGGTYTGELLITGDYGEIVSIGTPEKTGYTFTGWSLSGAGTYNNGIYTFGLGNGKLEAEYEVNRYNISYDYSSCALTTEEITALNNRTSYTIEDNNFSLNNPNKYGYVFEGWTGTDLSEKTINVEVDTSKVKNLNYAANCRLQEFTVTFKDGDTVLGTKQVEYKKKVTPITTPEKNGYTFSKWLLNQNEYDFDTLIESDITLQADFTLNNYTITYAGITDAERASLNNPTSYSIESTPFNLNNPENRLDEDQGGEVFVGWKEENDTTPSVSVTLPDTSNLGNKKYTAIWNEREPNVYNITYNLNGGTLETANPSTYKKSELPITLNNPTKEGYTFLGWTGSNGDTPSDVTIPTNTTGDLSYTANYSINEYNVDFYNMTSDGAYEKVNGASLTKNYNTSIDSSELPTVSLRGYTFRYWSLDKNTEYSISTPITSNIKLYAVYQKDVYPITYNLNGGTVSGNPSSYSVDTATFTLNPPTKTGYTFTGWTGSNGDTPETTVTLPETELGPKSYTANYNPVTYNISYDYTSCALTNEEITTLNNRASYTVEDTNFNLNNPSKYGYVFNGWTGTDLTDITTSVEINTSKAKNLSYTANCSLEKYSAEFYNINSNNEYALVTTKSNIEYNTAISISDAPEVSLRGYTFKFWSLDKSAEYDFSTPITSNIKLYAVYQKDVYPITYDLDGGSLGDGVTNPESYSVDTTSFTLNNPSKTGYDFIGWTGSNGDSPLTTVTLPDENLGPKNYTANYQIKKYKVTYMNGNDLFLEQTNIDYNTTTTAPSTNPTKAHNVFLKWLKEDNTEFNFSTPITEDITLYASWEEVEAPTITHTPTSWVGDKVTVTVSSTHPEYTYMYKVGSGSYQVYTEPFEVTENTTVYAYSVKSDIGSVETSHIIDNIDKINPTISSVQPTEILPESIKIRITAQDNESGLDIFKVYVNNTEVHTSVSYMTGLNDEKIYDYTITNLEQRTDYTIKVEAYDKVGNMSYDEQVISTIAKHYVARVVGPTYEAPYDDQDEQYYFETLKLALESDTCQGASCVIQMLEDVTESNVVLDGQDVTIDLNGTTITGLQDNAFENNGTLKIIDKNNSEIGKVYSEGTAIINNGTLFIGENETILVVDANEPIIEGTVTGINSPGELHFLDGKIIGSSTAGALKGTAPITPYSYNASVDTTGGKEIATLEVIADAEARINSVYFTKAQEAIDASKNGHYSDGVGSREIMKQTESKADYKFVYDEDSGKLTSNNKLVPNSTADSYIVFDLTNETTDKVISIDATISSQNQYYDVGYITVTDSSRTPAYDQENGRIMYVSGEMNDNVNYILEKGNKYYVHLCYHKDESYDYYDDTFTINSITLSDYDKSNTNGEIKDNMISDDMWHFIKQPDGSYVNRNLYYNGSSYNDNTTAHSYIKFDLTNEVNDKVLYVDASLTGASDNRDYAYITVTNTKDVPAYDQEEGRQVFLTGTVPKTSYEIKLKKGEINYVHFGAYYNWSRYTFSIDSVRLQDDVEKEHLNSDITPAETYYMEEIDYEPTVWKDLTNNHTVITNFNNWNETNGSFDINGQGSIYAYIPDGISDEVLDEESVEVEVSATTVNSSNIIYNGSNNEKTLIGIYNGYFVVSNNAHYNTFDVPDDFYDGEKKNIILTYNNGNYELYYNKVKLEKNTSTDRWYCSDANTYIGRLQNSTNNNFNGSIYKVKVYNRELSETEISSTISDTGLILSLDGSNHKKLLDAPAFINNNTYIPNTKADSYLVFDLTNLPSKTVYVNAEISSEEDGDYGFIYVNSNINDRNNWQHTGGRQLLLSGEVAAQEYPVTLTGGQVNYVHFAYQKNSSIDYGKDQFKINYVRYYGDSVNKVPTYILSNTTNTKPISPTIVLNDEVETVELLRNVTMTNPLEIEETRDVILDLRGYTLTTNKQDYVINNRGSLTIVDSDYDAQRNSALEKFAREKAEYDSEYDTAVQAKEDYINEKQAQYNTEYDTEMAYYNNKKQEATTNFNTLAEEYLTYMNSSEYDNIVSEDFDYTGSYQEFTAPFTGTYQIEAWGAQGNTTASKRTEGGKGAYTSGKITLNQGEKIYIYVGEHREDTNSSYNAGSIGGTSIGDGRVNGYGGGGATDIRLVSGSWNDQTSLASRIMVAGGGGGASDYNYPTDGGYGGTLVGGSGITGHYPGYQDNIVPTGGTQTAGGAGSNSIGPGTAGQFGTGGNGNYQWGSGGGGGYYGGGGGGWNDYRVDSGAGGSSYISGHTGSVAITAADNLTPKTDCDNGTTDITCSYHYSGKKFTDTVMKAGNEEMPSSLGSGVSIGQLGDGHVRISYSVEAGTFDLDDAKHAVSNLNYNYSYNGSYQEFTAPITAKYRIETWGAAGGSNINSSGGNGGYSEGLISLTKGDKLYIYVGEKGKTKTYDNYGDSFSVTGGYNGGGNGYLSRTSCEQMVSSGGGATDIRLVSGDWNSNQSLASRIMVAAGGGGSFSNYCGAGDNSNTTGGNAGGLSGDSPKYLTMSGFSDINPTGGTQTTGGLSVDDWQATTFSTTYSGSFGLGSGGTGPFDGDGSYSGGGAGYYGGASGKWQAGAGGSSYISGHTGSVAIDAEDNTNPKYGCTDGTDNVTCSYHYSGKVFEETTMKSGNEKMPSYVGGDGMIGNSGNGFARITFADNTATYETPNEKYDNMVSSLNVTDYFDTLSYKTPTNWTNKLNHNEATINGYVTKEDDAIRVNNIDSRNTVKIPIDNTGDTIIYSLVKVNQNASNGNGTRIIEIYSGLDFSYNTPMLYAYNNNICVDSYNNRACSTNIDFNKYNLLTMTISRDTNMLRLYVNGDYLTQIPFSDYGNMLWLSTANNGTVGDYGDNSFRMLAIGSTIPSDSDIKNNADLIKQFYNDTSDKVVIKKDATLEPTNEYTENDYITDGLQLHLDGIESGDDPTIWEDISGNNNDGNIYNLYKNPDGSYYFSASSSYVEVPNSPITIDDQETVEVLFKPDYTSSYRNETIYNGGTNEKITITTHAQYLRVGLSYSANVYDVPADFYDGSVKKLTVVYNNGDYTVYYNNTELTKLDSKDYIGKSTNTFIGRRNDGYYYTGSIYNVKVFDKALRRDEVQRNYNVDITRYNLGYPIVNREPTLEVSNLNGKVTNTNYSTIYNENGALLNIKEAVVEIDKEGAYYAVDNHGMLTMESDGYINARKRYNYGIYNAVNGDILNGSGTITTYLGDSHSIVNDSQEDSGFTGYNLVSTISSSRGMLNRGKKDIVINSINITGNGVGFAQSSDNKCTINNSIIDSNTQGINSIQSLDNRSTGSNNSEFVLNNISTNNTISNVDYSYRKIIIKDSNLSLKKTTVGTQVYNSTGEIELDNVTFSSCPNYYVENHNKATIKNSFIDISENCNNSYLPRIISSITGATMDITNTSFKNHGASNGSETDFGTNNSWTFVQNFTGSTMTIEDSTFESDNRISMAIQNGGGNLTIKGDTDIKDNFNVAVSNVDGWYYSRYSPTLTIGVNDSEVSTTYPRLGAIDHGVYTVGKKTNESYDGRFYFYDGLLIGKEDKTLYSSVSGVPVDYDINSTVATGIETIKLKPVDSEEQEDMVCKIGSTKYASIQDAVNHIPDNTETTIDIIKNIKTAQDVTIGENQIVKINFNNHYVKSHIYGDYIINNGNLKIYDDSASVSAESNFYSDNYIVNNGILNLNDIKLNGLYPDSKILTANGTSNTINSGTYKTRGIAINNNSVSTIINNGEFTSNEGNGMSLLVNSETGTMTINDGYFYKYAAYMINNNNSLTINDGTYIIGYNGMATVANYKGKATINGGTFDNSQRRYNETISDSCYVIYNSAEVELNDVTSKYGYLLYNFNEYSYPYRAEVTLNNVTTNTIYNDAIFNWGGLLTINNSSLSGTYRMSAQNSAGYRPEININGSTLQSNWNQPIITTSEANLNIDSITEGGVTTRTTISSSGQYSLSFENGSVVDIKDADITNTNTYAESDAIFVSLPWGSQTCAITINNSNITASGRAGIFQYPGQGQLTLNIGTKGTPVSDTIPKIEGAIYGVYSTNENTIFNFYDGRIIGSRNNAIVMKLNENEPLYDIVAEESGNKQIKYNAQVPAYKNFTSGEEYDSLQDAFDEASDNDTIRVQREVTIMASVAPASNSKTITFDLNGKKIIQNNATYITNTSTGVLTVKDSTSTLSADGILAGNGQIESKGSVIINNEGTLTLESGDFATQYNKIVNNAGIMVIENGKYYSKASNTSAIDELFTNSGTLTINNGYFKEVAKNISASNYIFNNSGTTTINDGIFEGIGYESYSDIRDVVVLNNSVAGSYGYIFGGSFKRGANDSTGIYCRLMDNSGTGMIKDVNTEFSYLAHNLSGGTLTIEDTTLGGDTALNYGTGAYGSNVLYNSGTLLEIDNLTVKNVNFVKRFLGVFGGTTTIDNSSIKVSEYEYAITTNNDASLTIDNTTVESTNGVIETKDTSTVTINNTDANKDTLIKTTNTESTNDSRNCIYHGSEGLLNIVKGSILGEDTYSAIKLFTYYSDKYINIGTKDNIAGSEPVIKGTAYGIYNERNSNTHDVYINFYDGIIRGDIAVEEIINSTDTYINTSNVEKEYNILKRTVSGKEEKYLGKSTIATVIRTNNTEEDFYDLKDAFDSADNNETVRINEDITLTSNNSTITIPSTKKITLDLNNHYIYLSSNDFMIVEGELVIDDSSQDKEGYIKAFNSAFITNNGTFTFNNGKLTCDRTFLNSIVNNGTYNNAGGNYIVYGYDGNDGISINNNGIMNITSGKLEHKYSYCAFQAFQGYHGTNFIMNNVGATINMSGGEVTTHTLGSTFSNAGTLNITGGDLTKNDCNISWNVIIGNSGNLNISNMNLGTNESKIKTNLLNNSGTATIDTVNYTASNGYIGNTGTLTMNDVVSNIDAEIATLANGTLNITGGSYTTNNAYAINITNGNGTANIKNTSITANDRSAIHSTSSNITIENSTITSNNGYAIFKENSDIADIIIKSGTIKSTTTDAINVVHANLTLGDIAGLPSDSNPMIIGKEYGLYNVDNTSDVYFYDGVIKGETGSINGSITETAPGYKEARDTVTVDGVTTTNSTLTVVGTSERVAVVNNVNFLSLQSAVNYASNNGYEAIQLYKHVTLEEPLVKPADGGNVKIYKGSYTIGPEAYYNVPGITVVNGTAPGASLSRFLANITGTEINPRNIVLFEMSDGTRLKSEVTYKLYKVMDGEDKLVKVNENKIGDYDIGNKTDIIRTTDGKVYINEIGEGTYKLVGSDSKIMTFTIDYDGVSNNIRLNNRVSKSRSVSTIATLILQLQTGMVRNPYILIIMILVIGSLGFIAYQKYKRED